MKYLLPLLIAGSVYAGGNGPFPTPGGSTPGAVTNNQTLWVDPINGNDATGVRGLPSKPFKTIGYWQVNANAGAVPFSPTGAINAAQAGDVIQLLPGYYTNVFVSLWRYPGKGLSLIGSGVNNTVIVQSQISQTDGGGLIQAGDYSLIKDFSYINYSAHAMPCAYGTYAAYDYAFAWTNKYTGFTNAVIENVWPDTHLGLWWLYDTSGGKSAVIDGFYMDGYTNESVRVFNSGFASTDDVYAEIPTATNTLTQFAEFNNCDFHMVWTNNAGPGSASCINLGTAAGNSTNIFNFCTFSADKFGTEQSQPINGVSQGGNTWLNNCIWRLQPSTNGVIGINSCTVNLTIVGGNPPSVSGKPSALSFAATGGGLATYQTNTLTFTAVSALTNTLGRNCTASCSAGTAVVLKDAAGNTVDTYGTVATLHLPIPMPAGWRLSGTAITAILY
jgi:hypothetical protein